MAKRNCFSLIWYHNEDVYLFNYDNFCSCTFCVSPPTTSFTQFICFAWWWLCNVYIWNGSFRFRCFHSLTFNSRRKAGQHLIYQKRPASHIPRGVCMTTSVKPNRFRFWTFHFNIIFLTVNFRHSIIYIRISFLWHPHSFLFLEIYSRWAFSLVHSLQCMLRINRLTLTHISMKFASWKYQRW